jgi:hypothetical protein
MSGRFFVSLTGLPGPATIYARLYVENSVGLAFSDEFSFITVIQFLTVSLDPNNSSKQVVEIIWVPLLSSSPMVSLRY